MGLTWETGEMEYRCGECGEIGAPGALALCAHCASEAEAQDFPLGGTLTREELETVACALAGSIQDAEGWQFDAAREAALYNKIAPSLGWQERAQRSEIGSWRVA